MLNLSGTELERITSLLEEEATAAWADNQRRLDRFARYLGLWRSRYEAPTSDKPNEFSQGFRVPVLKWNLLAKWAGEMDALLGDDAEVIASPTGPSDAKTSHLVGKYMTWRLFQSMAATSELYQFVFSKLLFGRAIAYAPWNVETYWTKNGAGKKVRKVWYRGPGFQTLWPEDIILPAEDRAGCVQDFSWVIRRSLVTPHEIEAESKGKNPRYARLSGADWDKLVNAAADESGRDIELGDERMRDIQEEAEGISTDSGMKRGRHLIMYEWHGKYSPMKGGKVSRDESDIIVYYVPRLRKVIGAHDACEVFPDMKSKRPFVETQLVKDGSYWCPSFGELLEGIEREATANHNLFSEAGKFTVGPVVFYRPDSGYDPIAHPIEPFKAIPCLDPSGINVMVPRANLDFPLSKEQVLFSYGERVVGLSDQHMGRQSDRPNAPRTARGTLALISQGNLRASLDTRLAADDFSRLLSHLWQLEQSFGNKQVFFRVTEESAQGLFQVRRGGVSITPKEFGGRYDFKLKFATDQFSREAKKEKFLMLYQLLLANPLIVQDPRTLALVTRELCKQLEHEELMKFFPVPQEGDVSMLPSEEWSRMQQGESRPVHPNDNDELHLIDHLAQMQDSAEGEPEDRDLKAEELLAGHIAAHYRQQNSKKLMQSMTNALTDQMARATQDPALGGMNARGPVPVSLGNVAAVAQGLGAEPEPMQDEGGTDGLE